MTKRLTPEQATLTPEIIAEIRALDTERDPEHRWLFRTAEIRWRMEALARGAIIPALDEIERLRAALADAGRSGTVGYGLPGCPVCGHDMGEDHAADCFIGAALAATDGKVGRNE
jgi:hypothetical protein